MTEQPFLSSSWHRVAALRPKLCNHVDSNRHRYRGVVWYVLQHHVTGEVFRLSHAGHLIVGAFDGKCSVDEAWKLACIQLGEEAPSQDDVIRLLAQLAAGDLIKADVAPDPDGLVFRRSRRRRARWLQGLLNPLSTRMKICDPNSFLDATAPYLRGLASWHGAALWLLVVLPAVLLALQNWTELSTVTASQILAADNIVLLAVVYLVLKIMHELGHAYAVKLLGGDVHDLGTMFLVFVPVPYVDASAAARLRNKWHRALVGAAGMIVEVFVASLALFVWLGVENGVVRAAAFDVMLISGVSTVIFNGNPLLRLDGYYILSDIIEIPNLAQSAARCWGSLVDKHLLRHKAANDIEPDFYERIWLLGYGAASAAYRLVVLTAIALFVASEYAAMGVLLGIWLMVIGVALPVGRWLSALLAGSRYEPVRTRAVALAAGVAGLSALLILVVPAPSYSTTEGVVWLPETAVVRARTNGFLERFVAEPGQRLSPGDAVAESEEPALAAELVYAAARVVEIENRLAAERFTDRARAEVTDAELAHARTTQTALAERGERLTSRTRDEGRFAPIRTVDLVGRFLREGQEIGYVLPAGSRIVRATVAQAEIENVRHRVRSIRVKPASRPDMEFEARILREVPAIQTRLPSKALGSGGGGSLPVDPRDPQGQRLVEKNFQFDLELPSEATAVAAFASRAYIRFDFKWEPVGQQLWRSTRQLLLARLPS